MMDQQHPLIGDYKHHTGTIYHVVAITNEQATKPDWTVDVVYYDDEGRWWSRPLSDFQESCEKI